MEIDRSPSPSPGKRRRLLRQDCGYQYPNRRPNAQIRPHSQHCGKALPPAGADEAVAEVEETAVGEGGEDAGDRSAAGRTVLGGQGGRQRDEIGTTEANGGGSAGEADGSVEDMEIAAFGSSAKLGKVDYMRAALEKLAQLVESEDSDRSSMLPPVALVLHRDLLERAWGWKRLVPRIKGSIHWDQYKTYLGEYYHHNADKAAASKETLNAAANLCISKEGELELSCVSVFSRKDKRLCIKIKEHARAVLESEGEYPAAGAALLCIKTEAEMMVVLFNLGYGTRMVTLGNKIRRSALNLMLYKGSECAAASGAMMGIAKEAAIILDSERQNLLGAHSRYCRIQRLRDSIAADLDKLEQELCVGTLASGKTGEKGTEKRNGSLNNQTETEEAEDGNAGASLADQSQRQNPEAGK